MSMMADTISNLLLYMITCGLYLIHDSLHVRQGKKK